MIQYLRQNFPKLFSDRFWELFLIGLAVGLNFPFPNNPWVQGLSAMIGVWFGGSVAVGTFDKRGDKQIMAAAVANGSVEASAVVKMPSTEKSVIE